MKLFSNNNTTFPPFAFSTAKNHLKKTNFTYKIIKRKQTLYVY